jgi:hypothetical protein
MGGGGDDESAAPAADVAPSSRRALGQMKAVGSQGRRQPCVGAHHEDQAPSSCDRPQDSSRGQRIRGPERAIDEPGASRQARDSPGGAGRPIRIGEEQQPPP